MEGREMPALMDDSRLAEDDEGVRSALAELRRAVDEAPPEDRAFVLHLIDGVARRLDQQRPG